MSTNSVSTCIFILIHRALVMTTWFKVWYPIPTKIAKSCDSNRIPPHHLLEPRPKWKDVNMHIHSDSPHSYYDEVRSWCNLQNQVPCFNFPRIICFQIENTHLCLSYMTSTVPQWDTLCGGIIYTKFSCLLSGEAQFVSAASGWSFSLMWSET